MPGSQLPDPSTTPFDDIRSLLAAMPGVRGGPRAPGGALGSAVAWAASWQGRAEPSADRPLVCLFAASHGFLTGSSADAEVTGTRRLLDAFVAGAARINAVCGAQGFGFKALELALDVPSGDIAKEAALGERECVATMAFGMEAVSGADLLAVGAVGRAVQVPAAAVLTALFGEPAGGWLAAGATKSGTAALMESAARHHGTAARNPLAALARFGGRDLAAIAGAILSARHQRVPVILDGFAAFAAAAILHALDPAALGHCMMAQAAGPAERDVAETLGLTAILAGLDIPDEQGLAGALALAVLKTAIAADRLRGV